MADFNGDIPSFLSKRGIQAVSDNVPEGHEVVLQPGSLFQFFGQELMGHLQEKQSKAKSDVD